MQKKKQKRSNRKAKRMQVADRKKTILRSVAPIAQSGFRRPYTKFSTGTRDGALRMETCFPMYQITGPLNVSSVITYNSLRSTNGSTIIKAPYAKLSATGGAFGTVLDADQSFPYESTILALMASSFTSYHVSKLKFSYEPQSPTTDTDRLVFAYASDPSHPLLTNSEDTGFSGRLLNLSDSIAFSPFISWELDVTKSLRKEQFYVYQPPNTLTSGAEDDRFNYFGMISCCGSVAANNNPTIHGVLYATITIEFFEFCPILDNFIPQLLSFGRRSLYGKDDKNDETSFELSKSVHKEHRNLKKVEHEEKKESSCTSKCCKDCSLEW